MNLCLNKKLLIEFLQSTQPDAWDTIQKWSEEKFLKRLTEQMKQRGIVDVWRKDVNELDLNLRIFIGLFLLSNKK